MSELVIQFESGATTGQDPVAVASVEGTLIGPLDVQGYDRYGVYAYNVGGGLGGDLATVRVQASPEDSGPWVDVAEMLLTPLVAGAARFIGLSGRADKYVRVRAACTADGTTARAWFCAGGYGA